MSKPKNIQLFAIIILAAVSLLSEVFVFNFRYFGERIAGAPHITVKASQFSGLDGCLQTGNGLTFAEHGTFCIANPGIPVNSIKFNLSSGASFTAGVSYRDENSSQQDTNAGSWSVSGIDGLDRVRLISSGKCGFLRFTLSDAVNQPVITSVELNSPYFLFSPARSALLFIVLLLIYLIRRKKLWDRRFDFSNLRHYQALFLIFAAAALLSIVLCYLYGGDQSFGANVGDDGDCYQLLTQAFRHGSLSLLQNPPDALAQLPNPYDPSARTFDYIFDSAYWNGRYYCYFGIAPVIMLLLPFNLLTGLYMPTSFACLVFMLVFLFALTMLYVEITEKWFPRIGLLQFIFGIVVLLFGSNLFWLIARPKFYELAVLSALSFLFLGFWLLLHASNGAEHPVLSLFFSGLCFALMVASRPTFIFYLAAALPFILPLMLQKNGKLCLQKKPTAAFFAPLAVFAVILMAYNYARFGSPFDFGQRYQLTISDIRFNKITNLAALPSGIYHYFFAPLGVDLTYPFFHVIQTNPFTSSGYYYNQPMAGIFNFPLLLVLFASVYILRRMPTQRRKLKHFAAILLIAALGMIYLDITLAGVLERYLLDILPVFTVVSLILWFEIIEYFREKEAAGPIVKLFCAVCLVTAVISTLCSTPGEYNIQILTHPQLYHKLSSVIAFWH